MRALFTLIGLLLSIGVAASVGSQEPPATTGGSNLKVILLGTAGGPTIHAQRLGISTLVLAGPEKLLFDCGRSLTTGLVRLGIAPADVTRVFLTHLHSDHIVSLPELLLFPWTNRSLPLRVWGPNGTRSMVKRLQDAFSFDIHVRRDVDERLSAHGIEVIATDIREGIVYEANGVRVRAFLVDHGPVTPAFGYRVDYGGRSVVMSGDTKPSDNLVKFSQGVDVLIHEVGRWKQDPALSGPPDEWLEDSRLTRGRARTIAAHHTDGTEAGRIFERARPQLAVFSHYNAAPAAILPLVRRSYAGPVEFGEDLMTIDIGDRVTVHRFVPAGK